MVMLHVAAAELPSQPGSLPAPWMIDHDGDDWNDWRQEFVRRFGATLHRRSSSSGLPRGRRPVDSERRRRLGAPLSTALLIRRWIDRGTQGDSCWNSIALTLSQAPESLEVTPA
jgi:hypothetical protein